MKELISTLIKKYKFEENKGTFTKDINGTSIIVNKASISYEVRSLKTNEEIKSEHKSYKNLKSVENWSTLILLIDLLEKGYPLNSITLEKTWRLGHNDKGRLDLYIKDPKASKSYMIEVKQKSEIEKFINPGSDKVKQLISYFFQEHNSRVISYYYYDFEEDMPHFYNIFINEDLKKSSNLEDFYENWNKIFDRANYISSNNVFDITWTAKKYNDLQNIDTTTSNLLFSQFLEILRLNSVSDKPNAFNKVINLFLAKIIDEDRRNVEFDIIDESGSIHKMNGLRFQYIRGIDTDVSFMKRLNDLYKNGMKRFLNTDVIDYSDKEVKKLLGTNLKSLVVKMIEDLRLKKDTNFSFIETFNDKTFEENTAIVRQVTELFSNFKFKYDTKQQFLGDFFEQLLTTSLKQEAGQFFTPVPLVDYMVKSLPLEKDMIDNYDDNGDDTLKVIDYACGAGHFLINYMDAMQGVYENLEKSSVLHTKTKKYRDYPYSWVNSKNIVGIEKDYRLTKTTKIATFLNGDGNALVVNADGINKFSSDEYKGTILASKGNTNNVFNYVIANPPYSVKGFKKNLEKNGITYTDNNFKLLRDITDKDSNIEVLFFERTHQLLKRGGRAAIVLPQSVLSGSKYSDMRDFMFKNFKLDAMILLSDKTFMGTTTSPVILFLTKKEMTDKNYKTLVITSPKYKDVKAGVREEEKFLGYKFSAARNKNSGITLIKNSGLFDTSEHLRDFISNGPSNIRDTELMKVRHLNELIIDGNKIYPLWKMKDDGHLIRDIFEVNPKSDVDPQGLKYIEISNIKFDKITPSTKVDKAYHVCNPGDILLSSLNPTAEKISIADQHYKVSKAIYILRPKNGAAIEYIEKLRSTETLESMSMLLDGFKRSYAKIHSEMLSDYIKI